jgi:hypothetical protein
MANGKRGKSDEERDISGYVSNDSDFYGIPISTHPYEPRLIKAGDEEVKQDFKDRAKNFNAEEWWAKKQSSLTQIANSSMAAASFKEKAILYNPYEGVPCARQLDESVEYFLERLPPRTTPDLHFPWIYIANPYRKAAWKDESSQVEFNGEGPADEDSNWDQWKPVADKLLEKLTDVRQEIQEKMKGDAKVSISKAVNVQKDKIVQKILDTAAKMHCTSGKVNFPGLASLINS